MAEDKQHATLSHLCFYGCVSVTHMSEPQNKEINRNCLLLNKKVLAQFNMWNNSSGFLGICEENFCHRAAESAVSSYFVMFFCGYHDGIFLTVAGSTPRPGVTLCPKIQKVLFVTSHVT